MTYQDLYEELHEEITFILAEAHCLDPSDINPNTLEILTQDLGMIRRRVVSEMLTGKLSLEQTLRILGVTKSELKLELARLFSYKGANYQAVSYAS